MERDISPAPSSSTLSTIDVRLDSPRSSLEPSSATSPTSFGDTASEVDAAKDNRRKRSSRAQVHTSSSRSSHLAGNTARARKASGKQAQGDSRSVSGVTLVDDFGADVTEAHLKGKSKALKSAPPNNKARANASGSEPSRTNSSNSKRVSRLGTTTSTVLDAVAATTSALGKRSRRVFEDAKGSLQEAVTDRRKSMRVERAVNTANAGESEDKSSRLFPNLKTESDRVKEKKAPVPVVMRRKKFLTQGLYSGQHWAFDGRLTESKNRKNIQQKLLENTEPESVFVREASHPMFYMEKLLELGRDYRLPYNILKPLPKDQSPKEWHRLNKNRFIGDAAATWKKTNSKLPLSTCLCLPETGCDDDCLNRTMQYECNEYNCLLGDHCGNRAFAELAWRSKGKNFTRKPPRPEGMSDKDYDLLRKELGFGVEPNLWHEGVEVSKTKDRGYGVRSMRVFAPGQVIVEYCGEIITPDEADRRMHEEYKDKTDFYLMTFHDGLIIDATRGSLCRFVNHSCEPNCRVEKWTVDGEPRMALFAGDNGIVVGEELTYDYNFDPFSKKNIQACLCGSENCRGVLGPKPTKEASRAAKTAAAASNLVKGVKRKLKEVFGDDGDKDQHAPKSKRVLPDPKALLKKATKQLTNIASSASATTSAKHAVPNNESRTKRAARRSSSTVTVSSRTEVKLSKKHSRTSINVHSVEKSSRQTSTKDLSLVRTKSVSPRKTVTSVVAKIAESTSKALQPVIGKGNHKGGAGLQSQSGSTSELLPKKGLKQSKLSFGRGNLIFENPDAMEVDDDTEGMEQEDMFEEVKTVSKKGGRSFAASVRSSAVRSVKGPQRAAAMMKIGLKGNEAVRKTIRQVSGAE